MHYLQDVRLRFAKEINRMCFTRLKCLDKYKFIIKFPNFKYYLEEPL